MSPRYPRLRYRAAAGAGGGGSSGSSGSSGSTTSTGPVDITGVTGTFTNGQTITVSGANLMNQVTTNWDTFWKTTEPAAWSFEGAGSTADGYNIGPGSTQVPYDSTIKLFGTKSLHANIQSSAGTFTCPTNNRVNYMQAPVGKRAGGGADVTFGLRAYGRWDMVGTRWPTYMKWIEAQDFGPPTFPGYYLQNANSGDGNPPTQFLVYTSAHTGSETNNVNFPHGGSLRLNRWYCVESVATFSATPANQSLTVWIDNKQVFNKSSGWTSEMRADVMLVGIINGCHTSGDYDQHNWTDGFVTGSSRIHPACVVYLADSSNYDTAEKVYQAPISISDTAVLFEYNDTGVTVSGASTGIASAPTKWVFVVNNASERSSGHQVV